MTYEYDTVEQYEELLTDEEYIQRLQEAYEEALADS